MFTDFDVSCLNQKLVLMSLVSLFKFGRDLIVVFVLCLSIVLNSYVLLIVDVIQLGFFLQTKLLLLCFWLILMQVMGPTVTGLTLEKVSDRVV